MDDNNNTGMNPNDPAANPVPEPETPVAPAPEGAPAPEEETPAA